MKYPKIAALAVSAIFIASTAQAAPTVLTFDDVTSASLAQLPQNYGGLTWDFSSNWNLGWQVWKTYQSTYPSASGDHVAFAHSKNIGVSFSAPSIFNGAFFGGFTTAKYDLFLNNQLVSSSTATPMGTNGNAAWIPSNYSGFVDRVQVRTQGGGSDWVMDNFTFTSAVPEPETYTLMLAGLGLMGAVVRRRKAKQA